MLSRTRERSAVLFLFLLHTITPLIFPSSSIALFPSRIAGHRSSCALDGPLDSHPFPPPFFVHPRSSFVPVFVSTPPSMTASHTLVQFHLHHLRLTQPAPCPPLLFVRASLSFSSPSSPSFVIFIAADCEITFGWVPLAPTASSFKSIPVYSLVPLSLIWQCCVRIFVGYGG